MHLRDAAGATGALALGQGFSDGDATWYFEDTEQDSAGSSTAIFRRRATPTAAADVVLETSRVVAGGRIGPYTVDLVSGRLVTGLTAVRDPGTIVVFVGLALVAAGLGLTFLQKRKETDA